MELLEPPLVSPEPGRETALKRIGGIVAGVKED
jgi:hypothetical protein